MPPEPPEVPMMDPWGAPLRVLEPVGNEMPPPREGSPAWGRTAIVGAQISVSGGAPAPPAKGIGVIRVSLPRSEELTLSIDTTQPYIQLQVKNNDGSPGITIVTLYLWALVTFGNGAANVTRAVRVDSHADIPLVASYVDVQVYLGDANGNVQVLPPGGNPAATIPTNAPTARVTALLAYGIRRLPEEATHTIFVVHSGPRPVAFQATSGQTRLVSVQADVDSSVAGPGAPVAFQLFDAASAPANGTIPTAEWPLNPATTGTRAGIFTPQLGRFRNTRGFANGLWYAASSTFGTLTKATLGPPILTAQFEILDL